jgi:hypothetical protein
MPVRAPRAWFNGFNVLSVEVTQNRYSSASSYVARMAVDAPDNPGAGYWAGLAGGSATVTASNGDGSGSGTLITGSIDHVEIDFETRIVTVSGRDKTGSMLDQRSDVDYANQQPESIVGKIAGLHGLGFSGGGGGGGMAGKTYDHQNFNFLTDWQNDWDAVQQLAQVAGAHAYVSGNQLFFETSPSATGGGFTVTYEPPSPEGYASGNFLRLHCMKDVNNAQGFNSKVGSYPTNDKEPKIGSADQ